MRAPTLQHLAFYANDHLGEGGEFRAGSPTSFEVVLDAYAHRPVEIDEEELALHTAERVYRHLRDGGKESAARPVEIVAFVQQVVDYLRFQFGPEQITEADRHLLSHLFRRHLVEAGLAHSAGGVKVTERLPKFGTSRQPIGV